MDTDFEIDPLGYMRTPTMDVPTTLALVASLVTAAPSTLTAGGKRALFALCASRDELEAGWKAQLPAPTEDVRPSARCLDRCWSATVRRVELHLALPAEHSPSREVALQVFEVLAPDGLEVIKAPFRAKWSHMKMRMEMLRERGLYAELTRLAGADFVSALERSFAEYGRALHITASESSGAPMPNLGDLRRSVSQRIGDYALQVLATLDRADPASHRAVLAALKPVDDVRQSAPRRAPLAPVEPVPSPVAQPVAPVIVTQPVAPARPAAPQRPSVIPPTN